MNDSGFSIINNFDYLNQISPKNPGMSLADLYAKSDDGVVQVIVRKSNDTTRVRDLGSGIVYDLNGHIITNNHVVQNATKITVTFHEGYSYTATIVGTDPFADLAVIKVNADSSVLHPLNLGDSSKLRIGEQVAAIGSPFGLTGSVTSGIISQVGRLLETPDTASFSIPDVIQTDTAINPGNSGGPLLNMQGKVIGINTAIQTDTGEFSGIGFAIPSNTIKKIVPVLIKDRHFKHPWIGITGLSIDPDLSNTLLLPASSGFMIQNVVKESPAGKAGIHGYINTTTIDGIKYRVGGDIIIGIDNNQVRKLEDILNYLQEEKSVGDKITLKILRDGHASNFDLILEERPSQTQH
ncbi:MAG: trypsin-like serine protease [Thaumarchaeota archaeon]|nr:MAG: trypsin-like serine protease [Nitrososphaerota archaeon]